MYHHASIALRLAAFTAAAALPVFAADGATAQASPVERTGDFIDSVGIGVHLGAVKSQYGDIDAMINNLAYLGVRHLREGMGGAFSGSLTKGVWNPDPRSKLDPLAAAGVRFDLIAPADFTKYQAQLDAFAANIETIEGPNEPENTPVNYAGLSGDAAVVAVQKDLYKFVKSDPALSRIPVVHFAYATAKKTAAIGDLSGVVDFGNIHTYPPHGVAPHLKTPGDLTDAVSAPGRPVLITETGYATNAPGGPSSDQNGQGHNMVDEDVQARYLPDAVLDAFKIGVVKTYIYELYDEIPDPQNTNEQWHLGVFRADGSRKPAADAIHNLNLILSADARLTEGGAQPPAISVDQSASGLDRDVNNYSLVLQKPGGAFDIILWGEPVLWTAQLTRAPQPEPNHVRLRFAQSYGAVRIYDPLQGVSPRFSSGRSDSVEVDVTDHPVVIELSGN